MGGGGGGPVVACVLWRFQTQRCEHSNSQLVLWWTLNSFSVTPSLTEFHTRVNCHTCKYVSGPPHLHSCSILFTPSVCSASSAAAAARPLLLWCQNKYHSFIWSCAGPWEETPPQPGLPPPSAGFLSQDGDKNTNITRLLLNWVTKTINHFLSGLLLYFHRHLPWTFEKCPHCKQGCYLNFKWCRCCSVYKSSATVCRTAG